MSDRDLKRSPHKVDANSWWYEDHGGISIVVHPPKDRPYTAADTVKNISWKSLRAALKRKDKK